MKPEHQQYIRDHIGRKSTAAIAEQLGIKERKVKKFLERQQCRGDRPRRSDKSSVGIPIERMRASGPAAPTGVPTCKRNIVLSVILIILLGFSVYANSLNGEFIWDDGTLVADNLYIRDWRNLPKYFTESIGAGAGAPSEYSFYRPLQLVTYAIDYSIWKLDVRGYHLTNIFWHVLASLTVFWFILILYRDWRLSLFTSLFFVVHPAHTEAVSYISGRADSMVLTFLTLCFIFYIKALEEKKGLYYFLIPATYVLAILSKEMSLILPFLLVLYHYSFRRKFDLKAIVPVLVLNVSYIISRMTVLSFLRSNIVHKTTYMERLAGFLIAMVNYIKIMILPTDLHMEYGNSFFKFTHPKVGFGIAVVVTLLVLIFKTRNSRNIIFFGLAWFLVTLLPSSGIIFPINAYMAEHWLYLPLIGIFLILAHFCAGAYGHTPLRIGIFVLCLLGFYSVLTINQNDYWKAAVPFYERTLKYANNSSRVYFNLGNAYRRAGEEAKAIPLYNKAAEIRPDYWDAYFNLGNAYENLEREAEAITAYETVIKGDPNYDKARYNLGNLYYAAGRYDDAVRMYEEAITINPGHINAYNNLGVAFAGIGQKDKAEEWFKKAIAKDPSHDMAYGNLAILYFGQLRFDLAAEYYKKAVDLGFVDPKFHKKIAPYFN